MCPAQGGSALFPGVPLTGSSWGQQDREAPSAQLPWRPACRCRPRRLTLLFGACHSSPASRRDFQRLLSVQEAQLASQTRLAETRASGQHEAPAGSMDRHRPWANGYSRRLTEACTVDLSTLQMGKLRPKS